jgi:hypothetical protein
MGAMYSAVTEVATQPVSKRRGYKRVLTISAVAVLALLATAAILLAVKWPFTQAKMQEELATATSGSVQIYAFQTKYFPPGCVMEGVEFRQAGNSGGPPLLTAERLTIRANYRGLFHKRIEVIHLEDLRVDMGQKKQKSKSGTSGTGSNGGSSNANSTTIAEIVVDRAVIEFPRKEKPPLLFNVHWLTFGTLVQGKPTSFHITLDNPLPPGLVGADGQFGPWDTTDIAATPLSGTYRFTDAKLRSLGGIAGTLSSRGSFAGPARTLRVQGTTDMPDFEVKSAAHPVHLQTQFQAVVNCTNGDVNLQSIRGELEKTSFAVAGEVSGKASPHSKVASLQVNDAGGRIEDWLRLLAPEETPPMTGPIAFRAHVTVPGGRRPFIQRVRLGGDFELTGIAFTKEKSQHGVSELSLRAQGQKLPDENEPLPKILGNLSGHVDLFDGVAHFSKLSFTVPGAHASMHGTYSFIDETIDLHGQLEVETKFAATATGPKGLVTRVVEPLFAKSRGKGEILPVKLTGSYAHASYGLDK